MNIKYFLLGISCNCLQLNKFVIVFAHQLYLHFIHHCHFLSHYLRLISECAPVVCILQKLKLAKNILYITNEKQDEIQDNTSELRQVTDDHLNVSFSDRIIENGKMFFRATQELCTQFTHDLVVHNFCIFKFVICYSTQICTLIFFQIKSRFLPMKTLHEKPTEEEIQQESGIARTENDEVKTSVHEIARKKLKSMSMETISFTCQFSSELVLQLKQTSGFFIWVGPRAASECYFMVKTKSPTIIHISLLAAKEIGKFSTHFVLDVLHHGRYMIRVFVFCSTKALDLWLICLKIISKCIKRNDRAQNNTSDDIILDNNINKTEDEEILEMELTTGNGSEEQQQLYGYNYTCINDENAMGISDHKEDDVGLYDSVKEAVKESAQNMATSMEDSVMEFTRSAVDFSGTEKATNENLSFEDDIAQPPVSATRPLSRASMSARLEILEESPPPSPTLISAEDEFIPLKRSFHRRRWNRTPSLLKSSSSISSSTDETDWDNTQANDSNIRSVSADKENQDLLQQVEYTSKTDNDIPSLVEESVLQGDEINTSAGFTYDIITTYIPKQNTPPIIEQEKSEAHEKGEGTDQMQQNKEPR